MTFTTKTDYIEELSEDILENILEEDYIVVLNKDGMIKTIIAPDEAEIPAALAEAFSHFGVYDLSNNTIH